MDYPLTRKSTYCPICTGDKGLGLVACWPCFRSSGLKFGDEIAEQKLDRFEATLRSMIREGSIVPKDDVYVDHGYDPRVHRD